MFFSKFKQVFLFLVTTGMLLIIPGCKRPAYNPKSLHEIPLNNSSLQTKNNLTAYCKLLNKQETHMLFDGRGSRLLRKRKPIYTLYLYIENNTDNRYILDPQNIDLKLINPELVAQRLYSHTSRRIILPLLAGSISAGATFLAAAYISIIGAIGSIPALVKTGYCGLGISGIFAASTPYVCYQQANKALTTNAVIFHDVMEKSLHQPMIIEPLTSFTTLLFVPYRCYRPAFKIKLIDITSQEALPYDIGVEEGERPCKK